MSRHPAPDRDAHARFCETEGWTEVTSATGAPVRHHKTFELSLSDGAVLRTRISRPVDRTTYAPSMWSHILRDQLQVSADVFWSCAKDGVVPARSAEPTRDPKAIPLYLLDELINRVGMPPELAVKLSPQQATEAIAQYWKEQS